MHSAAQLRIDLSPEGFGTRIPQGRRLIHGLSVSAQRFLVTLCYRWPVGKVADRNSEQNAKNGMACPENAHGRSVEEGAPHILVGSQGLGSQIAV
jgi:hypothetical protein